MFWGNGASDEIKAVVGDREQEFRAWFSRGGRRKCYFRSGGSGGADSGLDGEVSMSRSRDESRVEADFL